MQQLESVEARIRNRLVITTAVVVLAVVIGVFVWLGASGGSLPLGLQLELHPVGRPFLYAMFASGDWGVLWYLTAAILGYAAVSLRGTPAGRRSLWFGFMAIAALLMLFGLTNAGEWAVKQTALSRLLMQFAPALFLLANLAVAPALTPRQPQ